MTVSSNSPEKVDSDNNRQKTSLIKKVLSPDRVTLLDATTKDDALQKIIDLLSESQCIGNREELADAVFKREQLMSTGIGLGLAVPHVRLASVRELVMAVGISKEGISDYAALDDKPVHLIFLIAAPEGQHTEYLRLLSAISSRAKLLNGILLKCSEPEEFYRTLVGEGGDAIPD